MFYISKAMEKLKRIPFTVSNYYLYYKYQKTEKEKTKYVMKDVQRITHRAGIRTHKSFTPKPQTEFSGHDTFPVQYL